LFLGELAELQFLADGVAIHASVASSALEEAAGEYVSKVEAYCRKASPAKKRSSSGGLGSVSSAPLDEVVKELRGVNRRLDFLIQVLCEQVSHPLPFVKGPIR
jgi:hypothetical protein